MVSYISGFDMDNRGSMGRMLLAISDGASDQEL